MLYSVGANAQHGQRRTPADKHGNVSTMNTTNIGRRYPTPMRLIGYHGTAETFERFDLDRAGASGLQARGRGVGFHTDIRLAEPFAGPDGRVIQVEILLQHPAFMDESDTPGQEATPAEAREFSDRLIAAGHDGVVVELPFTTPEVIVFDLTAVRVLNPAMTRTQRQDARTVAAGRS